MIHSSFDLEISKYTKVKARETYICKKILKLSLQNVEKHKNNKKDNQNFDLQMHGDEIFVLVSFFSSGGWDQVVVTTPLAGAPETSWPFVCLITLVIGSSWFLATIFSSKGFTSSLLFPHTTLYSPSTMNTAPIILQNITIKR